MPLDRLAQQWCGIQFSGFSSLFYSEWSNKNHTDGRAPKQVCGASSDDVLTARLSGQVAAVTTLCL